MTPEFRTDGVFDVYKMLDIFRERPRMYLGEESLTNLWWLLNGYQWAFQEHGVPYHEVGPLDWKFHYYVRMHFRLPPNTQSYAHMILEQYGGDEPRALAMFFDLLDEFRRQD